MITNPILDSNTVTQPLIATGIGLIIIGCTMLAWGPHVGIPDLTAWLPRYRAHRHLYLLWHDLQE